MMENMTLLLVIFAAMTFVVALISLVVNIIYIIYILKKHK